MSVELVFEGTKVPQDHMVWRTIAEAVLGTKNAYVVARETEGGWRVSIHGNRNLDDDPSTVAHPHADGDFERELRQALRAAGMRIVFSP